MALKEHRVAMLEIIKRMAAKQGVTLEDKELKEQTIWDQLREFNESEGNLSGFECDQCHNKGVIGYVAEGEIRVKPCNCRQFRSQKEFLSRSALRESLTLESFLPSYEWQDNLLKKAENFVEEVKNGEGQWFFVSGRSGCGKTHICTGVLKKLFETGKTMRYMMWRDMSVALKSTVTEITEYQTLIKPLKEAQILYIDDFFKCGRNADPTDADCNLAFEIINKRYADPDKITIISTELSLHEIYDIDEAIAGRIFERCNAMEYCVDLAGKEGKNDNGDSICKNYRLGIGKPITSIQVEVYEESEIGENDTNVNKDINAKNASPKVSMFTDSTENDQEIVTDEKVNEEIKTSNEEKIKTVENQIESDESDNGTGKIIIQSLFDDTEDLEIETPENEKTEAEDSKIEESKTDELKNTKTQNSTARFEEWIQQQTIKCKKIKQNAGYQKNNINNIHEKRRKYG